MKGIDAAAAAGPHTDEKPAIAPRDVGDPGFRTPGGDGVGFGQLDEFGSVIHGAPIRDKIIAGRTILISDAPSKPLRQNYRMSHEILLSRIAERLAALWLSERAACKLAGVGENSIRHIRVRGHAPKADTLAKLAIALRVPPSYFLDVATDVTAAASNTAVSLGTVHVRGAVQAGVWSEATEWPSDEWYAVTVPLSVKYMDAEKFGLEVRGTSMDRLYPDGTVVIAVKFSDIGRNPRPGERVVVLRRNTAGVEATLKEYALDERGRHVLWPRSSDPEFQVPFVLTGDLPMSAGDEMIPKIARAAALPRDIAPDDIIISALVIGSYRPE